MHLSDLWPAAGLRASAGNLQLRWIDDELLLDLAQLASRGVHSPETMPFTFPWTVGTPQEVARSVLDYQWGVRGRIGPALLRLELGVLIDGVPVGIQAAGGDDWSVLRQVETGSWLGLEFHGRGIGTRMRALMLELLFEGLDARTVTSAAYADNAPSNAVSRRVGYLENGSAQVVRGGAPATQIRYEMTREGWLAVRQANRELLGAPVVLDGVAQVRKQLQV